ncbi:MAG: hypothetical protein E6848_04645 [Bradyrhizobium sp.]|nr:hypothetical protein [Bradyrhizobium sp.]
MTRGLRQAVRRMAGIGVFSGVINILMLSGSIYMMQVYDRVIPSKNMATLIGLSVMILFVYIIQGYFDALRTRMLCRVATVFDASLQDAIHHALATLPLRGTKPMLMQQPLRDLDQLRAFMSSMGPTAFLDMPWIPIFLIGMFLFHPLIGVTAIIGTMGAKFVYGLSQTDQVTPDMELPSWLVYLCIPLGSYLMCFRFLQVAWHYLRHDELPHHDHAYVEGVEATGTEAVR